MPASQTAATRGHAASTKPARSILEEARSGAPQTHTGLAAQSCQHRASSDSRPHSCMSHVDALNSPSSGGGHTNAAHHHHHQNHGDDESSQCDTSVATNSYRLHQITSLKTNELSSHQHLHHYRRQSRCNEHRPIIPLGKPAKSSQAARETDGSPLERLFTLLLPFLFVFLLPTIKLAERPSPDEGAAGSCSSSATTTTTTSLLDESGRLFQGGATSDMLLALIRLPFDKIRLQSAGLGVLGVDSKEIISSKSDLQEEETHMMLLAPAEHRSSYGPTHYGNQGSESQQMHNGDAHAQVVPAPNDYSGGGGGGGEPSDQTGGGPQSQGEATVVAESASGLHGGGGSALQTRSDLPAVRALNVKCEKNHMTVNIVFDRPFSGMVFSKGHYNDQKCVHLPPNSGQTSVNFDIHLGKCGMSSSDAGTGLQHSSAAQNQQQPNGVFIENTIIIQYDPLVQEIYDQARKLRCTWYDYYEKSVTFRPYGVDMLDAVTANFLGDNIQCWMQIQVGKGPWSSEVAGIVKIGQTMTMVLAIKDDENRFDMLVRNCVAHDGKHQPIQLVDEYGCVARPKIMGKFQKVRNFGPAATVVSYAHFQAFKFPDSMNVHFQCVIQVCRYECPEPVCAAQPAGRGELPPASGGVGIGGPLSNNDYATSGTEMVASKELLPHTASQAVYFNPTTTTSSHLNNSQHGPHHGSNINLKLDESQGRVQVKLDTSMMAALGSNGRPPVAVAPSHTGPLPPHLLHATQPAGAYHHQQQQQQQANLFKAGASNVASNVAPLRAASVMSSVSPPNVGRHVESNMISFSPQFPLAQAASRRSTTYTSRLGETAAAETGNAETGNAEPNATANSQTNEQLQNQKLASAPGKSASLLDGPHSLDQLAPYEAEYPLSLIASPRGFFMGGAMLNGGGGGDHTNMNMKQAGKHLHRVKRDFPQSPTMPLNTVGATKRQARHLRPADSTSVQTHKSIQVVSPDDVAFSLLAPDQDQDRDDQLVNGAQTGTSRRRMAHADQANSVCFSASRFLWAVLVTLTALISSIVIVTYVILRQRSQLEQKLSTVYAPQLDPFQPPQGIAFNYASTLQQGCGGKSQSASSMVHTSHGASNQMGGGMSSPSASNDGSDISAALSASQQQRTALCSQQDKRQQRQQAEAQQRNKYLARLYSQFSPAAYWH